jgi:hypothetical protein
MSMTRSQLVNTLAVSQEPSAVSSMMERCEAMLERGIAAIEASQRNFAKHRQEMRDAIRRSSPNLSGSLMKANPAEYQRLKAAKKRKRIAFLSAYDAGKGLTQSMEVSGATRSEALYWTAKYRSKVEVTPEKDEIIRHAHAHGVPRQFVDFEHGWKKMTAFWTAKRMGLELPHIHQARDTEMERANRAAESAGYKARCEREGDRWWFVGCKPETISSKVRVRVAA